jgi:RimJ/RimL family protein N-acetyltransferase
MGSIINKEKKMKKIILKDGREMTIRRATISDASKMVQYVSVIGGESDNLTFGLNEFELTAEREELIIESMNSKDNSIMIVGEIDDQIVSMLSMNCGTRPRTRHVGEFGISVRKPYWSLGIGNAMITYLINWAKDTNIVRKINLKARSDNANAIALYKKHGFKEEGVSTRDLYINGGFYDCMIMGLEID